MKLKWKSDIIHTKMYFLFGCLIYYFFCWVCVCVLFVVGFQRNWFGYFLLWCCKITFAKVWSYIHPSMYQQCLWMCLLFVCLCCVGVAEIIWVKLLTYYLLFLSNIHIFFSLFLSFFFLSIYFCWFIYILLIPNMPKYFHSIHIPLPHIYTYTHIYTHTHIYTLYTCTHIYTIQHYYYYYYYYSNVFDASICIAVLHHLATVGEWVGVYVCQVCILRSISICVYVYVCVRRVLYFVCVCECMYVCLYICCWLVLLFYFFPCSTFFRFSFVEMFTFCCCCCCCCFVYIFFRSSCCCCEGIVENCYSRRININKNKDK